MDAFKDYDKRLKVYCTLKITELEPILLPGEPSEKQIANTLEKESEMIEKKLSANALTVAMCIEGKQLSSVKLSEKMAEAAVQGRSAINFIIGSSYGLAPRIKSLADIRLSMSEMTFPHQLARVMLLEQIYRAYTILSGAHYHK